jgi:hypothetical protein
LQLACCSTIYLCIFSIVPLLELANRWRTTFPKHLHASLLQRHATALSANIVVPHPATLPTASGHTQTSRHRAFQCSMRLCPENLLSAAQCSKNSDLGSTPIERSNLAARSSEARGITGGRRRYSSSSNRQPIFPKASTRFPNKILCALWTEESRNTPVPSPNIQHK